MTNLGSQQGNNHHFDNQFQSWIEFPEIIWMKISSQRDGGLVHLVWMNQVDENKIIEKDKPYYFVNIYRLIQIYQLWKLIRKQIGSTSHNSVITINPDNVSVSSE